MYAGDQCMQLVNKGSGNETIVLGTNARASFGERN